MLAFGRFLVRPDPDVLNAADSIFVNGGRRSILAVKKASGSYVGSISLGVHK